MQIDAKRIIGNPMALLSVSDFFVIGLMAVIFLQMSWIGGMALSRFHFWRLTGKPQGAYAAQAQAQVAPGQFAAVGN